MFSGILRTGCGAGIACDGRPLPGPNGVGGEWGHNPLPWNPEAELTARPYWVLALALVVALVSAWGVTRLENRFIDYFHKDTEIYQGMSVIDRQLGGTITLDVILTADADSMEQVSFAGMELMFLVCHWI